MNQEAGSCCSPAGAIPYVPDGRRSGVPDAAAGRALRPYAVTVAAPGA